MKNLISSLFVVMFGMQLSMANQVGSLNSLADSKPLGSDSKSGLAVVLDAPKFEPVFLDDTIAQRYPRVASGVFLPRHGKLENFINGGIVKVGRIIPLTFIFEFLIGQKNLRRLKNLNTYGATMTGVYSVKYLTTLAPVALAIALEIPLVMLLSVPLGFIIQVVDLMVAQEIEKNNPYLSTSVDPSAK